MKKFVFLLSTLIIFSTCSSDSYESLSEIHEKVVGVWQLVQQNSGTTDTTTYEFDSSVGGCYYFNSSDASKNFYYIYTYYLHSSSEIKYSPIARKSGYDALNFSVSEKELRLNGYSYSKARVTPTKSGKDKNDDYRGDSGDGYSGCGSCRGKTTYRGERGGCYYYNSNGNKEYVESKYCC